MSTKCWIFEAALYKLSQRSNYGKCHHCAALQYYFERWNNVVVKITQRLRVIC